MNNFAIYSRQNVSKCCISVIPIIQVKKQLLLFLTFLFFIVQASLGNNCSETASVLSDKDDYAPGETAYFTAAGFEIGEAVEFHVLHIDNVPNTGGGHLPWTVVDGSSDDFDGEANGIVETSWYVNPDDSFNSTFQLTAVGLSSGIETVHGFTDDTPIPSNIVDGDAITTSYNSSLDELTITVDWEWSGSPNPDKVVGVAVFADLNGDGLTPNNDDNPSTWSAPGLGTPSNEFLGQIASSSINGTVSPSGDTTDSGIASKAFTYEGLSADTPALLFPYGLNPQTAQGVSGSFSIVYSGVTSIPGHICVITYDIHTDGGTIEPSGVDGAGGVQGSIDDTNGGNHSPVSAGPLNNGDNSREAGLGNVTIGCDDPLNENCPNPINASPSCNALKIIVVLDESGSIDSNTENDVEEASLALAEALIGTGAQLAFVEFATTAAIGNYGGYTNWNLVDQAYYDALNDTDNTNDGLVDLYGDWSNTTSQYTNWEDALLKVLDLNAIMTADIVLFMTDGEPNRSINNFGNPTQDGNHVQDAVEVACQIKLQGTHMFALGIGNVTAANLIAVTGPILDDGPGDPTETPLTADYGLITSGDLTACFLDIAQNSCNNDLQLDKTVYAGHDSGAGCDGAKTIPNPNNSEVTYCFTITNAGQQTISNLDFSDLDINIDENDLSPPFVTSIASGASVTYYYQETLSGGTTFPFNNTATVTGETPVGDPLSDSSSAEVTEPLCDPGASCINLDDVPLEGCTATVPSNYDAGNAW